MILTHKTRYCEIHKTRILRAPVFKHHIKNITPYKIYSDNIEMFDAFADTVANFCPVSLNIVDYWNKSIRTHDTYVWAPTDAPVDVVVSDVAFGWRTSNNHGFKNKNKDLNPPGTDDTLNDVPGGWPAAEGGGRLLGERRRSFIEGDNEKEDGTCYDKNKRFFINPLIGIQDKLAMTYLNNFYSTYHKARQNTNLRSRLLKLAEDESNNLDASKFFKNPNALFTEEKTVANKTFIMKKGTEVGLRYAQKSAYDAELQGKQSFFYLDIKTPRVLDYEMSSNILVDIFEKFVKPLAHPIGFTYSYKAVCRVLGAEDVEHPMVKYTRSSNLIEVNCLCKKDFIEGEEDIACGDLHKPLPKVFALSRDALVNKDIPDPSDPSKMITVKYMQGLWSGIQEDAWGLKDSNGVTNFNILKQFKESYGLYKGEIHKYKKYIFENDNYLIVWFIQGRVENEAPKVFIEYYRVDYNTTSGWSKVVDFDNSLHCNVSDNLISLKESQIKEEFSVECVPSRAGNFIMDVDSSDPNYNGPDVMSPIYTGDVIGQDTAGNDIIKFRGFVTPEAGTNLLIGGRLHGAILAP